MAEGPQSRENLATRLGNFILEQIPYEGAVLDDAALRIDPDSFSIEADPRAVNRAPLKLEGPLRNKRQGVGYTPAEYKSGYVADQDVGALLESHYWYFACRPRRVTKAMRLKYTYRAKDGSEVVDHILIGFEGSGGDN